MPHNKVSGLVTKVIGDRWWVRIQDTEGEMKLPIEPQVEPGSRFTLHRTKRGEVYLHWIDKNRSNIKRFRGRIGNLIRPEG